VDQISVQSASRTVFTTQQNKKRKWELFSLTKMIEGSYAKSWFYTFEKKKNTNKKAHALGPKCKQSKCPKIKNRPLLLMLSQV
jgi:hypothetical protein